jgi:hypothetical protein
MANGNGSAPRGRFGLHRREGTVVGSSNSRRGRENLLSQNQSVSLRARIPGRLGAGHSPHELQGLGVDPLFWAVFQIVRFQAGCRHHSPSQFFGRKCFSVAGQRFPIGGTDEAVSPAYDRLQIFRLY